VKKLKWTPDVIHCQGWISSIIPLYIKTAYAEEPSFRDCRVVFTPSDTPLTAPLPANFPGVLQFRKAGIDAMEGVPSGGTMQALNFLGIKYADGVNLLHANATYRNYIKKLEKPYLGAQKPENYGTAFPAFYDKVWSIGKEEEEDEDEE
jgi:starch synthase